MSTKLALTIRKGIIAGAQAVHDQSEDINRLNVFPVPDGDTGINMALTLKSVATELEALEANASLAQVCERTIHGSLMGARGNSGVITSQIMRGLAEYFSTFDEKNEVTSADVARAFKHAVKVSFNAVRKPVEGTILTVLKETADHAEKCARQKMDILEMLDSLVAESFEAVKRTPEKLPVLKENGVVDAGGMGLATFLAGFVAGVTGRVQVMDELLGGKPEDEGVVAIELNDDWDDSEFTYCTEFLFHAKNFDEDAARIFLSEQGDCDLLVGAEPNYKVHVHTDHPDRVLNYMLERGDISEVHIHNMRLQAHERTEKIAADGHGATAAPATASEKPVQPEKPLGIVAVASGSGMAEILESLGVDHIISGGQTMNPSTKDILDGINAVNAAQVIVLPNNKNIIMAAQSAAGAASKEVGVVPTKSVPQAFAALFNLDTEGTLEDNLKAMTEALAEVHDGEVTTAVKDSTAHDGSPIKAGDVMGICDDKIVVVGSSVQEVACDLAAYMVEQDYGSLMTLLAGKDLDDEAFGKLQTALSKRTADLEIEAHRGEQPLYPVIFSLEP